MNLNQNAVSAELVSSQRHKTSFGTMYACILIVMLILMSIAQFFLPVSTIKAENGKKYSISLSELTFISNNAYEMDITCTDNHSELVITGVLAISCICLAVCAVYIIIGIIQMMKNTNKACTTLTVAFIPMVLAKLSLFITHLQIKNYAEPNSAEESVSGILNTIPLLDELIIGSVNISIFFIITLTAAIAVPIISLKTIHRT